MDYQVHLVDVKNAGGNYIWLIEHCPSKTVVVVDPTEAAVVEAYCLQQHLSIQQIWLTHWHKDHTGGVADLIQSRSIPVFGPELEQEKIPFITHPLGDLSQIHFHDLNIQILHVPGHTLGHIVYYAAQIESLFCGDTLLAMGCGRLFEGSYTQMFNSLQRLKTLPHATKIYCTHEYTLSNAEFAITVEPENLDLQQRHVEVQQLRAQQQATLPSQLSLELATNPFLRVANVEQFQKIRQLKDQF